MTHAAGHRIATVLCALALTGCGAKPATNGPHAAAEPGPKPRAMADVDARATLALKQDLANRFPAGVSQQDLEQGLAALGYECGVNPAATDERACLQARTVNGCSVNAIVRTKPYDPDKSQVITICPVTRPQSDPKRP